MPYFELGLIVAGIIIVGLSQHFLRKGQPSQNDMNETYTKYLQDEQDKGIGCPINFLVLVVIVVLASSYVSSLP